MSNAIDGVAMPLLQTLEALKDMGVHVNRVIKTNDGDFIVGDEGDIGINRPRYKGTLPI